MQGRRVEAIEWLRGLAALWVLAYHVNQLVISDKYFGAESMGPYQPFVTLHGERLERAA